MVYDHSYQYQFSIGGREVGKTRSLCALRNGDLANSSDNRMIYIWRINEDDCLLIHILKGHTEVVWKVIELEDGRIYSLSRDNTIKIWDNNTYQSITTFIIPHDNNIRSIIEMNDSVIYLYCIYDDKLSRLSRLNKLSYECTQTIENVPLCSEKALEKLNDNTILIGGLNVIYFVDIESSEVKQLKVHRLGYVECLSVIRNDLVLFGNGKGEICCYNTLSNQIFAKTKFHDKNITCLIKTEDNKIISVSDDGKLYKKKMIINIYQYD